MPSGVYPRTLETRRRMSLARQGLFHSFTPKKVKELRISRECPLCHTIFTGRPDRIYCSRKCQNMAYRRRKSRSRTEKICPQCQIVFLPSHALQKYCSPVCGWRMRDKLKLNKSFCRWPRTGGINYEHFEKDQKQCSKCKKVKSLNEFYKDSRKQSGYVGVCKECKKEGRRSQKNMDRYKRWASATLGLHKRKGFTINISINELVEMAKQTVNCLRCGRSLNWGPKGKPGRNSPTLDRIHNGQILSKDTVQILCLSCNSSKSNSTVTSSVENCIKYLLTSSMPAYLKRPLRKFLEDGGERQNIKQSIPLFASMGGESINSMVS